MKKLRLGFIGAGWIGMHRLKALVSSGVAEVGGIFDPQYEGESGCASVEALFERELDGVVIATPSALHAAQTIHALKKGVPVFCQKPLGRNAAEVSMMLGAARVANLLLGVDLSYRHLRGMGEVRKLLKEGALGKIFAADLIFHNAYGPDKPWFYDPQQSGGGCLVDLGIHLVDAALWLLGGKAQEISGRIFKEGRPAAATECEDFATAHFDLSGAVVNLACSWKLHAGHDAVIEIALHGTAGGIAIRNVAGSFYDFTIEHFTGTSRRVISQPPDEWGGRAAVAWAQQLLRSCDYDPEIESQLEVARVLDAIYGR